MQFVIILSFPSGLFCFPQKLRPKQVTIHQPNQVHRRSNMMMIFEYLLSLMHKVPLIRSSPSYHKKVSFSTVCTLQILLFFVLIYDENSSEPAVLLVKVCKQEKSLPNWKGREEKTAAWRSLLQVVGLRELWTELEKKNSDNCSARVEVFWMWHYYGLPGAE